MSMFSECLLLILTLLLLAPRAFGATYCVPVEKIDFNPFRPIADGKELAYLMLLKSYISTDPTEPGILAKYEFSPDGKLFTGKVSQNLTWRDGSPVTASEAADGITKSLRYRALGGRVTIDKNGVELIDPKTFRIHFHSDISNLTGVIREALSTNSRHNRFWPIRNFAKPNSPLEVLAKFPTIQKSTGIAIQMSGLEVLIGSKKSCDDPDFTIFPETLTNNIKDYLISESPTTSAITLQPNTELSLKDRKALSSWIRTAFAQPNHFGIKAIDSFFVMGETGYQANLLWKDATEKSDLKNRVWKIAYEIPVFRIILETAARDSGIHIAFYPLPSGEEGLDAQILSSGIIEGRHVILQDALQWPHVSAFLSRAPLTSAALKDISRKSASTIPIDLDTLSNFQKAALAEQSLVPVARKHPTSYSKPNLPVCLTWAASGELTFVKSGNCKAVPEAGHP